ncbi:CD2 antigen cytoplasmic tail-binding protein 2 homolog isoform X1 [Periplaneta americana]|uniref:CD2 antigen cytoplasmic tail-binding protein 2 homolog isoform X1 n=1 Tax=Periplaneta americana TaxID=6978 RepID=UPI0037E9BEE8
MLELMKPGETVAKSLRRLGGNKTMSASERWRRKKTGQDDGQQGNQQQVTDLTELANRLLTETGNMDIYQESYEHISKLIEDSERKNVKKESRSAINYDDALDMYAEDFDEKEKARLEKKKEGVSSAGTGEENGNRVDDTSRSAHKESEEVMWEFKWDEKSADVHGPHTTTQMQEWVEQGYFKNPVYVRKYGTDGNFYNSSRIDFELYL